MNFGENNSIELLTVNFVVWLEVFVLE